MVRGDGWLVQEAWSCREQGVQYASIVGAAAAEPGKMQVGSVSECKQKCSAAASCAGFSYSAPEGVCRFVASVTDQASGENDDVLGFRTKPEACYSRTALRPAMSAEAAWTECQGRCQQVYTVNPLQAADLDALHGVYSPPLSHDAFPTSCLVPSFPLWAHAVHVPRGSAITWGSALCRMGSALPEC